MKALLLVLLILPLTSAAPKSDVITWQSPTQLSWRDFKGNPKNMSSHDAYTYYQVEASAQGASTGKVRYAVQCTFDRSKSWVKTDARSSEILLAHEQLHFDIGECSARAFRQVLKQPVRFDEIGSRMTVVHDSITAVYDAMQDRYDAETGHGVLYDKQEEWSLAVAQLLEDLAPYHETTVESDIIQ